MRGITKDVQSLSAFRRSSSEVIRRVKKTRRPVMLTVKGRPAAILQDTDEYQRLLDLAALADPREGIRQGLEQSDRGEGQDIEEFFAEFEAANGISR